MEKVIINTDKAPAPIGPYSQAVKVGNLLYVSGQIAINPATGEIITNNIVDETNQVMQNIKALLHAAGYDFEHVVKTSIFLSNMNLFNEVNGVYATYFVNNFPARETVAVAGLPRNVNVEISVVAYK